MKVNICRGEKSLPTVAHFPSPAAKAQYLHKKVGPLHEKNFYNNFCENEKVSVVVQSFKNKNKIEYNCRQLGRPSIDFSKF